MSQTNVTGEPLISVIVPVYNIEEYLRGCIESILGQTYKNIEIILVNDGSSDSSPVICDQYKKADRRVKVVHQSNGGVSRARNSGLDVATGYWVMFVDGDDILPRDAVSVLLETATSTGAACVSGAFRSFYNENSIHEQKVAKHSATRIISHDKAIESLLYQGQIANAPFAKLYRRDSVAELRFPEDITVAEDLYFNYQFLQQIQNVAITTEVVYCYRDRPNSAINTSFSHRRMSGLAITEMIVQDAAKRNEAVQPAINRYFMEAVFIGIQIIDKPLYKKELEACKNVIKQYRREVLKDRDSPIAYSAIALVAFLSSHLALLVVAYRASLEKR